MADNLTLNTGTGGDTLAADDIGGVKYPRTKLTIGADGVDDGDVSSANPLPVVDGGLALALHAEDAAHASGDQGIMVLAVRADAEAPLAADGDYSALQVNQFGRLKVSAAPADVAVTTGSITANAQTVFVQIQRFSNLSISMVATSLVGHNVTFECSNNSTTGSDGNWYAVQVVRSNANTVELTSGVLAATPGYMWQVNVSDYQWFRVRATAHGSGTAAYTFSPSAYVSEPVPAIQTTGAQAVTMTSTTVSGVTPTASNINSGASTNTAFIKASAGTVWSVMAWNNGASPAYVKFYNQTTAPTLASAVPIWVIAVPATSHANVTFGTQGNRFGTGIAIAIVGGAADTDTTAVAAAQVKVSTAYT